MPTPPLPKGASYEAPSLPKGASYNAPEEGNMYTQGAEDIVYSPEGIPLTTSSYGSAPTGATKSVQEALTSTVGLPLNIATGAAKPVAGMAQTISKLFGSNAGDVPVNVINQIERGTQAQMGGVGKTVSQAGSIAGEVAPYVMSPMKTGAPTILEGVAAKAAPYVDKAIGVLPSYAQNISRNIASGIGLGTVSGLATPEATGLTPEEFAQAKGQNVGIQSAIGGSLPVVGQAAKLLAGGLRKTVGMSTGAGEEAIGEAYKAGKEGNQTFLQNLKGQVPVSDVLDQAKEALNNIRNTRLAGYKEGIKTTMPNQEIVAGKALPIPMKRLDFAPITSKLDEAIQSLKIETPTTSKFKIGKEELNKVNELESIVNEWKKDPSLHTTEGLDALKQRLDALYPESPLQKQAQRVITSVRNTVKDTIVAQDKNYAKTMAAYEESLSLEREIERALSLNNKASADTAIRKLQSLTRNNANTSFAYRKELANALKTRGGEDLMPSLAGQALSSWTPRGIVGQGADVGALIYALSNPAAALSLAPAAAITSPKIMGTAAYGAGKLSNVAMTPEQQKLAKLLIMQSAGKAAQ
jgi:hypothetical protein